MKKKRITSLEHIYIEYNVCVCVKVKSFEMIVEKEGREASF